MQDYKMTQITPDEIVPLAERMRRDGRALVMIHAFTEPDGTMHVSWDYAVGNCVESYYVLGETTLPTISHIYDSVAEWPELELHELLGLCFEGLDMSRRLFLPEELLETQGKGQILVTPLSELVERRDAAAAAKAAPAEAAEAAPAEAAPSEAAADEEKEART